MTSNINPNNIDGTYPVAGQDNNSQGFRDNFTNTKTNFEYAKTEITDLQAKAIVNSQLTGGANLSVQNNMLGSPLIDAVIQDFGATRVNLGSLSGSVGINYAAGHYQTVGTSGSISLAFTNFPAAGVQAWVIVRVTVNNTAHTLTLPSAVGYSASAKSVVGIQGISSNVITFAETGTYEFQFHTEDNGASIYLSELTRPRNHFTNPLFLDIPEVWNANGNVSLATTTTVISSAANLVGNLHAGSSGQIKVIAYGNATSGNTSITVDNAGWGGISVVHFTSQGSACTLQYINSKWYCIGNNGASFS